MRSIFGPRGVILIWVFLTATIGLGTQLKQLALELRTLHPDTIVVGIFEEINQIPPKAINVFFDAYTSCPVQ
jgi:hypothetical protein